MKDTYLVIGGSGFVGRHIVQQLLARGDNVSVFDIVQRYHDTPFYPGDITEQEQVAVAIRKVAQPLLPVLPYSHLAERDDMYHSHCFSTRHSQQPRVVLESERQRHRGSHWGSGRMLRQKARIHEFCWCRVQWL